VERESVKRALRDVAREEPGFFAELLASLPPRELGRVFVRVLESEEVAAQVASLIARRIAVPLDVATRQDLRRLERRTARLEREVGDVKSRVERLEREVQEIKNAMATKDDLKQLATKQDLETAIGDLKKWAEERFATKEDIKRIEDKMATKEQIESITISVEDSGREMVQYLLEQRGYRCVAERLRLDAEYELDIYCNAGALTAVGEAKVRAGRRDVERTVERIRELQMRWPEKISGRLVSVLYSLVAEPSAVQRAKELKVWLIEGKREVVSLEEVL